jgi:hypothetical protein
MKNQLALEATIMEFASWVEQPGAADVADNALDAIHRSQELVKMTFTVMMTPL